MSTSLANSTESKNYDVFLSFRGKDTRNNFVDHLYKGLDRVGLHVFRDDDEVHEGEKINDKLFQAIENSEISIPILSENYASSKWCLQELVQMIECMNKARHVVLPIFYWVEPTNVRHQKGRFGEGFARLSGEYSEKEVEKWKQVLQDVASLKGWEVSETANRKEGKLVEDVVKKVWEDLKKAFQLFVPNQPVGFDDAKERILQLLDDNPYATRIVGIHGMWGIGKTTLAKVVYNELSNQFQLRSFIANIKENSQRNGIAWLQNKLIFDILGMKYQGSDIDEGINILRSKCKLKKVLILLDDVNHHDQLKSLVGKEDWFNMGSRIIITTRIKSILDYAQVNRQYHLMEIKRDQSLILFSRHAFCKESPRCGFEALSIEIVSTIGGLPLALEFMGKTLCGKNQAIWQEALKKLRKVSHVKVQEKLRIRYDTSNYK
ncbi:hypothetical protein EUGRSUZ_L03036 [Eucalyptus grandis]|uniref:TIR domain-containing protein n=1 Tax=Eucalyptus grandis TaxID=71139 RepID=A0AAD9WI57_EUCGR|nr:hypothetical protein EUGRSUZ_L03036 [Eucalyptus grandis]